MKQLILLIFLAHCWAGANASQPDSIQYKTLPKIDVAICFEDSLQKLVDNQFEIFDQALFDRAKGNSTRRLDTLSNGTINFLISNRTDKYMDITLKDSPVLIIKNYYTNGYIKDKGLYINNSTCHLGTWYEFDESGNLTDSINYSEGFKHSFCEIYTYARSLNMQEVLGEHFMKFYGWNPKVKEVFDNPIIYISNNRLKDVRRWILLWRFSNEGGYWIMSISIDDTTDQVFPVRRNQDIPEKYRSSTGLPSFP